MLHPIREFHGDPLSAGVTYGFTSEAGGALAMIPGGYVYLPVWQLILAAILAVGGFAITFTGVWKYNHQRSSHEESP